MWIARPALNARISKQKKHSFIQIDRTISNVYNTLLKSVVFIIISVFIIIFYTIEIQQWHQMLTIESKFIFHLKSHQYKQLLVIVLVTVIESPLQVIWQSTERHTDYSERKKNK